MQDPGDSIDKRGEERRKRDDLGEASTLPLHKGRSVEINQAIAGGHLPAAPAPLQHRFHPRGLCSVKTISAVALRFFRRANYDFKSLHVLDVEPARARDPVRPYHNSLFLI